MDRPYIERIVGMTNRIYGQIIAHIDSEPDREVGGVLVGEPYGDGCRVIAVISFEVRGQIDELTIDHDAWAAVHATMDEHYPESSIVGWYHSHPGHGIFLSEKDQFIHRNFFGEPWQLAYVIDPHSREEGVFGWNGDVLMRLDRITPMPKRQPLADGSQPRPPVRSRPDRIDYPWLGFLVPLACGIVLGFLIAAALGIGDGGQSGDTQLSSEVTAPESDSSQVEFAPAPDTTQTQPASTGDDPSVDSGTPSVEACMEARDRAYATGKELSPECDEVLY